MEKKKKLQGEQPGRVCCWSRIFEFHRQHTLALGPAPVGWLPALCPARGLNTGSFLLLFEGLSDCFSEQKYLKSCQLKASWKLAAPLRALYSSTPLPLAELRRWGELPGPLLPGNWGATAGTGWLARLAWGCLEAELGVMIRKARCGAREMAQWVQHLLHK